MEQVHTDGEVSIFDDKCVLDEVFFNEFFERDLLYPQLLDGFVAYNRALELNPIVSKFRIYRLLFSQVNRILQSDISPLSEPDQFDVTDNDFDLSFKHLPHSTFNGREAIQNDAISLHDADYDGDDITTMSVTSSTAMNSGLPVPETHTESSSSPDEECAHYTTLSKVKNAIMVVECIFHGFSASNKTRGLLKNGNHVADTLILVLRMLTQSLNEFWLTTLFECIRYRFHDALNDVDRKAPLLPISYLIISETLGAIERILEAVNSSFSLSLGNPNNIFAQSLLSSCVQVDFTSTLEALLALTVPKRLENGHFKPPKLSLSVPSLTRLITILAFLLVAPAGGTATAGLESSADITNIEGGCEDNYYNEWLIKSAFDQKQLTEHFKPLLGRAFKTLYEMDHDLMASTELKSWLTGWFLSKRSYNSVNATQILSSPLVNHKVPDLASSAANLHVEESPIKASSSLISSILPVTVILRALVRDPDFTAQFVSFHETNGSHNNLLEEWLCILSYVFTYQHKSMVFQSTTALSIEMLIESMNCSENLATDDLNNDHQMTVFEKLSYGLVDEYEWKLCHQKLPIIPLFSNKTGYKPCIFYILDVSQCLLRYNLTNKINVSNYRLAMNLVYLIVNRVKDDANQEIGSYQWAGLFTAMFALARFIWKQHTSQSKHLKSRSNDVLALIEETLLTINEMLTGRFTSTSQVLAGNSGNAHTKPIAYSLVYNLLLHYQLVSEILTTLDLTSSSSLHTLAHCLVYFEERFHMTEASKSSHATLPKVDLFEYDIDSRELEQHLMTYFGTPSVEFSPDHAGRHRYPATMQYLRPRIRNEHPLMTIMSFLFCD